MLSWVPVTEDISRRAGEFARAYRCSHAGIGVVDYLRAGTSRSLGADLVTTNVAHFPMFADLRPPYPHCGSTKCAPVRAVDRWARPAAREGRSGEAIR